MNRMVQQITQADEVIDKYEGNEGNLIQILLEIQREERWLPKDTLERVGQRLGIPLTQIYHIATFYKAFSLVPRGRHSVSVCTGTACHVRGAPRLLDRVTESLKIEPGQTSEDMYFSLDTVNCLGCCALGPVLVLDGEYHSNPTSEQIETLFNTYDNAHEY